MCEDGYASSSGNRPSSCEFEIESLSFDQSRESSLRVGDWDYYKFTVEDHQAHERTLLFEMTSRSPHSQPIMLVRKGRAPELSRGFLPSADAFYFDYQDTEGFYLRRGQRQAVTVPKEEVTAGDWYVGIFNIWGYTGFDEFESHRYVRSYTPMRKHRRSCVSG